MVSKEMIAYWLYQISNVAIILYLCFLKVSIEPVWLFYIGIFVYSIGLILCTMSMIHFAKPSNQGLNVNGLYRYSRNPMYIAYFIYFWGCVILTHSLLLAVFVLIFQITSHWIIRAEERWCIENFGETYTSYMNRVRRYL